VPGQQDVSHLHKLHIDDVPLDLTEAEEPSHAIGLSVTTGTLEAMGIRLVQGRLPAESDMQSDLPAGVVTQQFADTYLRQVEPLGRIVSAGNASAGNRYAFKIIGVIENVRLQPSVEPSRQPPSFFSTLPQTRPHFATGILQLTRPDAEEVALTAVRSLVAELEPGIPIYNIRSVEKAINEQLWGGRLMASLFGAFATLSLIMAALGIYSVLSHSVAHRTLEIGVRAALGASPSHLMRSIGGEGLKIVALGLVIGLVGAYGFALALRSVLFEVRPWDPLTYGAILLLLLGVALLACAIPARKALRIPPSVAMRGEGT
jgi:hypothetical protein